MYLRDSHSLLTEYISSFSRKNKYKGLLNANFADYMDALKQAGTLQIKSGKLKQKVSAIGTALGTAVGVFGGPAGMALGFSVGNTAGKYVGNVISDRIFGQAIADVDEIAHDSKIRHAHIAASYAFENQIGSAIDTLRENENKRLKDALQGMSA